ncbi:MAG: hypothetical protein H6832_13560 [Planctomycetes bacterium]|nr:hypothetical protein [Planctomycetota bacterium]MCB9919424.1 hypothetical protein [Planctomycetota bacterium]
MSEALPREDDLLLQRALDGELAPAELRAFESRLEQDAAFERRFAELEALLEIRRSARPRERLPIDFADRIVARAMNGDVDATGDVVESVAPLASETGGSTGEHDAAASAPVVHLRVWLERAILVAAVLLIGITITLFARPFGEATSMDASPEVRAELRELYDRLAERERLQRIERERADTSTSESEGKRDQDR